MQIKTQNQKATPPKKINIAERLNHKISNSLEPKLIKQVFIGAALSEMIYGYFGDYHNKVKEMLPTLKAEDIFSPAEWEALNRKQQKYADSLLRQDKKAMLKSFEIFKAAIYKISDSVNSPGTNNLDTLYELQDIIADVCAKFFDNEKGEEEQNG